jgi:hypothetical protein
MKVDVQKILVQNKVVTLDNNNDYKAAGGQAVVYVKDNVAYKIYHDSSDMIAEVKIRELCKLQRDEILSPKDIIYNMSKDQIGFTMSYIDDTEFLCQIFTKTFRDDKNITTQQIIDLVKNMQESLKYIHTNGILVVDYNEMNFLLDKAFCRVYHIDVDSWQTKNFNAPVIMESIRDRTVPMGQYSEVTDWFSWAVVTFQMYIGIHPYKGIHPTFKPAEFMKRMDLNVSVFDKDVTLPDTCQPFSVIPKKHLEWYKAVFMKKERSVPPYADDVVITAAVTRVVGSKGDFIVKLVAEVEENIRGVIVFYTNRYIVTSKHIYDDSGKKIYDFKIKSATVGMCDVFNQKPIVAELVNKRLEFFDLQHNLLSAIEAEDMMGYNGMVYSMNNGKLIENSFELFGKKIIHSTIEVCNVGKSYKAFRGVVVQDVFIKCRIAIPFERKSCINIHINELDGHRIIDARYDKYVCIVMSEKHGKYTKTIIYFNNDHSSHTLKQEEISAFCSVNFVVLPNKLAIAIDDEKLSIFTEKSVKEITTNLPLDVSMRLHHQDMQPLFVDGNKLYSVSMK